MSLFLRGLLVGFSIAAPVGPIGLLCIRRSLADGRAIGLATGLGAATADACYGAVAAFGLSAVSRGLLAQRLWLQLAGGALLIALGVRTALASPAALRCPGSTAFPARCSARSAFPPSSPDDFNSSVAENQKGPLLGAGPSFTALGDG